MDDKNQQYYEYLKDKYSESYGDNEPQCLSNIYGKDKCCPNITKLRKILEIYKENNSRLYIISKNAYLNQYMGISTLYVKDIKKNTVYLSSNLNNATEYIIPINEIKFISTSINVEENKRIEDIVNKKAKENKRCCTLDEIVDEIKESAKNLENINIAISDMGTVLISPLGIRSQAMFTILSTPSNIFSGVQAFPFMRITAVSNEIVLASISASTGNVTEFLIPADSITGVNRTRAAGTANSMIDSDENTSIVTFDKDGNMINFSDMDADKKTNIDEKSLQAKENAGI